MPILIQRKSHTFNRTIINIYSTTGEPVHTELYLEISARISIKNCFFPNTGQIKDHVRTLHPHTLMKDFSTLAPEGYFYYFLLWNYLGEKDLAPEMIGDHQV